jgi:hypothetical protein
MTADTGRLAAWACGPGPFERYIRERIMAELATDYEQTFDEFWREIVVNPDGTLNLDALKRELHDYRALLENVPEVYAHVSGGKVSKANTDPVHVKAAHEDLLDAAYDGGKADERERCVAIARAEGKVFEQFAERQGKVMLADCAATAYRIATAIEGDD